MTVALPLAQVLVELAKESRELEADCEAVSERIGVIEKKLECANLQLHCFTHTTPQLAWTKFDGAWRICAGTPLGFVPLESDPRYEYVAILPQLLRSLHQMIGGIRTNMAQLLMETNDA